MNKPDYTAILLQQPSRLFHTQDLAVLWQISNPNTLYTTIKRYCQRKILFHVHKGFYSSLPLKQLNPRLLGLKAVHTYAYISCETILIDNGLINVASAPITLISNHSKHFSISDQAYHSRQLSDRFLYNPAGIETKYDVRQATVERAVADMLYFNPHYHFDAPIDWPAIQQLQGSLGYPLTQRAL